MIKKRKPFYFILILLPFLSVALSLFIGRYNVAAATVPDIITYKILTGLRETTLFNGIIPEITTMSTPIEQSVVWDIRLPRAIGGIIVGGALSVSGASLQGMFKNPLVDAGILGVSSGAGFGAILAIILFNEVNVYTVLFAFIFGMIAVGFSTLIAGIYKANPTIMLVLGGVIVSSVFSSLISLGKFVADPFNELPAITFWLMGSLASCSFKDIAISFIPIVIGTAGIVLMKWRINVLSMGERDARTLGINTRLNRGLVVTFASLSTAGAVSIAGTIGWVGLVIPHLGRMMVGTDNRKLIPVSLALGSFYLVIIDLLSRTLTGSEIPLGILTSLLGAPFYVYVLKITKGSGW
ncbi:iron complex transport system permease protein [Dethiosulfatibacter aminovorans DSM 17477]|uniref:Iron complex transport system permease protein n=1 Tax=Dethiosulfatibacter aminovorans DSM 17477 TaxID=1121476 RepID=A0A1M6AEF2_9FIRM|nr:iron ABC transporter permease [Dethiosulfatibacter aminovorans]SHI34934.1 iron complex transport system permease protein [Dethiosulfatibacter aminovorans DSM 17477]